MKSKEATNKLTNPDKHGYDTEEHELPAAMIEAFNTAVETGSKRLELLTEQAVENDQYLRQLLMARERGEVPQFLKLRPKEIMYLPEERSKALNKEFQDLADEASKHMLNSLIATREEYQASLFQKTKAMRDASR